VSNKPVDLSVPVLDPDDIASLTSLIIRHFPKCPKHDR